MNVRFGVLAATTVAAVSLLCQLEEPATLVRAQTCCTGTFPICDYSGAYCDPGTGGWVCGPGSPIIVEISGHDIELTDVAHGVLFDLRNRGVKDMIAWTRVGSDDAWLVLDRNGNGTVDNGSELFGDVTPQSAPLPGQHRNGFRALAVYDELDNGGNADGLIDAEDAIFGTLRLWRDRNHDGISQADEISTLGEAAITGISVDYRESWKRDQYGNAFRYRAQLFRESHGRASHWAWDVFLKIQSL